jgi:hypothetical protein
VATVASVVGVLVVAAIACIAWLKRSACTRCMSRNHTTTSDKLLAANNSTDKINDTSGGSFSKATTVADNPRRNSSARKSGSMLIAMDSGIVIDSVQDVTGNKNDVEHGTAGTTSTNDTNIVDATGTDEVVQATSTAITTTYSNTVPTQHEAPVPIEADTVAPVEAATTIDVAAHVTKTDTSDVSSDAATGNNKGLDIQSACNEASETASELTIVPKDPWTNKVGQASRLVTTCMSTVTQQAVAAHGDKVALAYELGRAVAEHIPYVKNAYGLLDEVVQLFGAGVHINSNCNEVVAWARDMQVCSNIPCIHTYMLLTFL